MYKHTVEVKYHGWYDMWCVVINGTYDVEMMFETEELAKKCASTLKSVDGNEIKSVNS